MNSEGAIDILVEESKRRLIDSDQVQVFIDVKVFHFIDSKEHFTSHEFSCFSHYSCDVYLR